MTSSTLEAEGAGPATIADLAREYLDGRAGRAEIAASSARAYREWMASLVRFAGDRPVHELDRALLLDWQASTASQAPSTRRKMLGLVRVFCRWLVDEGHLESDPSVRLVAPREPRRAPRALPADAIPALFDASPAKRARYRTAFWLRPALALMLGCGLRCEEVTGLDVDDYDPAARKLFVRGKGGHQRILPVPAGAAAEVDAYLRARRPGPGPLLVATGSKAAPDERLSAKWVSRRMSRLMGAAGVHRDAWDGRTAHALRHTFATDTLAASGNDILAVQALMGHTSLATTQRYLAPAGDERLRRAVEGRSYLQEAVAAQRPGQAPQTQLHCPACCHDPAHRPGCGGWQPVSVAEIAVVKAPASSTGWRYSGTCPACRRPVAGEMDSDRARQYLQAGARAGRQD